MTGAMSTDPLTPAQASFVASLATGASIRDAAAAAGVTPRTTLRWREKPAVREALAALEADELAVARALTASRLTEAVETVVVLMENDAVDPRVRLAAAKDLLDRAGVKASEETTHEGMEIVIRWPERA